jgi:hypothetical protein
MALVDNPRSAEEGQGQDLGQEGLEDQCAVGALGVAVALVGEAPNLDWHFQSLYRRRDCSAHGRLKEGVAERARDAARIG